MITVRFKIHQVQCQLIAVEELLVSIPLDVEEENEESVNYTTDDTIIQPQPFNNNPEEIEFPLEYFTNAEQNVTTSDNDTEEDDYVIETEKNPTPHHVEYPIVNYERDINLQEDIDNEWERVENDQVPDYCFFIGNEGLSMNTTSHNPEDFFNNLFDDRMYTIITEETNNYVRQQIMKAMENRDPFQYMDHYS